jgi:hypothetical protein
MKRLRHSKKRGLFICIILLLVIHQLSFSQIYNPINYNFNGTPTYGVKIKTNLPFITGSQMPTVIIEGYNYGEARPTGLILTWYIFNDIFWNPEISSFGADIPSIKLSNENGKVIIFIDAQSYFRRFSVRVFAQGKGEVSSWFDGWQIVDEPLNGTQTVVVPYQNSFSGTVNLPGGIWRPDGSVGIGTTNPEAKLTVKGKIEASEIQVKDISTIPDYVFKPDYKLMPLNHIEEFVKQNQHLPDVPSEKEFKEKGMNMVEMNALLLKKIEELTLYVIEQNKHITDQNTQLQTQDKRISDLDRKIKIMLKNDKKKPL